MKKQIAILKRLGAPEELIESFEEVCSINEQLPQDSQSSVSKLLEQQCRSFGFSDILPEGWFFRPYTMGEEFCKADIACKGDEPEAAAIEQSYRRGYVQGFSACLKDSKTTISQKEKLLKRLNIWRRRTIQRFGTPPGGAEKLPKNPFVGRSGLSPRIRYQALSRDNHTCKSCGRSPAKHGVIIEIDHIVAVSKGGNDEMTNLQTLCEEWNRGKSNL